MESSSKPTVTESNLIADMRELYALKVSEIKELESYDDTMFLITAHGTFVIVWIVARLGE